MKKSLFLVLFTSLTISAFAQFPDAGSKGFTFGISGTSGLNLNVSHNSDLLYKFYVKDDFVMRYSALVTLNNTGSTSTNNGISSENQNNSYNIGLGIGCEKIFAKINRFAIYGGADLVPSISGGGNSNSNTTVDQTKAGGIDGDFTKTVTKRAQIFGIGIDPFVGFEFFISKNFSLGAEFSLSATYSFPGKGTTVGTSRRNGIDAPEVDNNTGQDAQFTISSANGALITGSIYF